MKRLTRTDVAVIVLVMVGLVAALWWQQHRADDPDVHALEYRAYQKAYGPQKVSRGGEEWFVRDFFRNRRGGVFVDVGAYDYRNESNTYYLETALGWSGIAIDANAEYREGYVQHRPKTEFFALFVSDRSDAEIAFYVPTRNPLMASATRHHAEMTTSVTERKVPTITLNDILARRGIERFDFLTMDIELAEPKALAGFDIQRYRPALVCIEGHRSVRQAILDYFARSGYVLVSDYLRADEWNLWFKRLT
jgi:FkbM family methyltransferase